MHPLRRLIQLHPKAPKALLQWTLVLLRQKIRLVPLRLWDLLPLCRLRFRAPPVHLWDPSVHFALSRHARLPGCIGTTVAPKEAEQQTSEVKKLAWVYARRRDKFPMDLANHVTAYFGLRLCAL